MRNIAHNLGLDVSQIHDISDENISAPQNPTQAMQGAVKSDNIEIIGKLNSLNVAQSGYYVFKVTLGDELFSLVKDKNISDYKFYGLSDSESQVSSSLIIALLAGGCSSSIFSKSLAVILLLAFCKH